MTGLWRILSDGQAMAYMLGHRFPAPGTGPRRRDGFRSAVSECLQCGQYVAVDLDEGSRAFGGCLLKLCKGAKS